MKKTLAIFTALCALTLNACFSPWGGGDGTITISFGAAGRDGRVAVSPDERAYMTHVITLTGPSDASVTHTLPPGYLTANIAVSPGAWNIGVRAEGPRPSMYSDSAAFASETMVRAFGSTATPVQVVAGGSAAANIAMIHAVGVYDRCQLNEAIRLAGSYDGAEKVILIKEDIAIHALHGIEGSVVLVADRDVRITRAQVDGSVYDGFMFDVSGGTLTLGRPGMGGGVVIDGGGGHVAAAIIRVGDGALAMNQGVTLTGNRREGAGSNGGAVEVGESGTFAMYGGAISDNSARRGGGVHVAAGGAFVMSGGAIYGVNGPGVPNSATLGGASLFVEIGGTAAYGGAFLTTFGDDGIPTTNDTLPHGIVRDAGIFTISFASFHEVGPIPGPTIAEGETATLTLQYPEQYDPDGIVWFMGGTRIADEVSGTYGETLYVGPSLHGDRVMTHFVTVEVGINGRWYSQVIALEVTPTASAPSGFGLSTQTHR